MTDEEKGFVCEMSSYHEIICRLKLLLLDLFVYPGTVTVELPVYCTFHKLAIDFCSKFALHENLSWKAIDRLLLHSPSSYLTHEEASDIKNALDRLDVCEDRQTFLSEEDEALFSMLHAKIYELAYPRMAAGCYADAVESVFKEINCRVKEMVRLKTGDELDGEQLMQKAFTGDRPIIRLESDLRTQTARDIQKGYRFLFAGAMSAIRNPKAHDNLDISRNMAFRFLMFGSLLMEKLDKSCGCEER